MDTSENTMGNTPEGFLGRCSDFAEADTVILDFDETLWFRNSTEEFLASARPSIFAAVILQLLGFLKPWKLFGKAHSDPLRDLFRVSAILLLMPWTLLTWRVKAKSLGPKYLNTRLLDELTAARGRAPEIMVATLGFRIIVRPLLDATGRDLELVVASSLRDAARTRRIGKGAALRQCVPEERLKDAIFLTNSTVDSDVFELCREAHLVDWPEAEFRTAGSYPSLPFAYITKVKRPDENYILHGVIGYDLIVGLLAYAFFSDSPLVNSFAFVFYLIGFFAVYEIGYFENDTVAVEFERKPRIPEAFAQFAGNFSEAWAWVFGLSSSALASLILASTSLGSGVSVETYFMTATEYFLWSCVLLLVTRLTFYWFNRSRPWRRIFPMLILQLQRTLGYALIFPLTWVGAALCVAHAAGRWFPYVIYRFGGERKGFPSHLFAFLVFIGICFSASIFVSDLQEALNWQFVVVTAYLLLRATIDGMRFWQYDPDP